MKNYTITENTPYNRQINWKLYVQYFRGYLDNGREVESEHSRDVYIRYRIHLATRSGNWFGYPLYVQAIEGGGRVLEGGYQIKSALPSQFDILHVTNWHKVDTITENNQEYIQGVQIVVSDSTGSNKLSGYHKLPINKFVDPHNPTVVLPWLDNKKAVDTSKFDYVLLHWQHRGGNPPVRVEYRLKGETDWINAGMQNPIRINVERGKNYIVNTRGFDAQGRVGNVSYDEHFTSKTNPIFNRHNKMNLSSLVDEYEFEIVDLIVPTIISFYGGNTNVNDEWINRTITPENPKVILTSRDKQILFGKSTKAPLNVRLYGVNQDEQFEDNTRLVTTHSFDLPSAFVRKNGEGVKKGRVFIKVGNQIKSAIIYVKRNNEIWRGV